MAKQSKAQQDTIGRVMHEFKHGELKSNGDGAKVKDPKQAIAIALHQAGATNTESPSQNRRSLRRTKGKERRGETAQADTGGRGAQSKAALYAEAKRRKIPGRSTMSKAQLERAMGA